MDKLCESEYRIMYYAINIAISAQCCAAFGQGTGNIVLDNVGCSGSEASIFDCPHNGLNIHNCVHAEDASVVCQGKRFLSISCLIYHNCLKCRNTSCVCGWEYPIGRWIKQFTGPCGGV